MQVLWCIPERVHSPQFKASLVVSTGFFGDGGDAVGVGTRFPIRFLLRQAGTSADIFEARPRPFVLLPLLMQRWFKSQARNFGITPEFKCVFFENNFIILLRCNQANGWSRCLVFQQTRRDKGKYPLFGRKVCEMIRSSVLGLNFHWTVSNLALGSFVPTASCRRSSRPVLWCEKDFLGMAATL